MSRYLPENFSLDFSMMIDFENYVITDGIFKGLKIKKVKEENGEYTFSFTRMSKNAKPLFSVTVTEPYINEQVLIDHFIDYLSTKCAKKIVDFSFNSFATNTPKKFTKKEIPVAMKNTQPAFFAFFKDQLIESVNNDTAALTVKKENTAQKYFSNKNSKMKFENCVNQTFNDFFDLCDEKIWKNSPEQDNGLSK